MLAEPLRVLVWSPYPALRADLSELIREGGLDAVGEIGASLEAAEVDADVLVAHIDSDGAERDATRLADLLSLPAVFMVASGDLARVAPRDLDAPRGWISRDATAEELTMAIRAVAAGLLVLDPAFAPGLLGAPRGTGMGTDRVGGGTQLTARELDVLRWLALGLPNKAIALKLGISEHTVKFHVGSVLSKLDARSRTEAVTTAARLGVLTL